MSRSRLPREESPEPAPRSIPTHGWLFGFDEIPGPSGMILAANGDLFEVLKFSNDSKIVTARAVVSEDRRKAARYAPAQAPAMIGWWKGAEFVVLDASIVNLSQGGTLLELPHAPNRSQPVWVCRGEPRPADLAQGRVLDAERTPTGSYWVRVSFHSPCPPTFLDSAGRLRDSA